MKYSSQNLPKTEQGNVLWFILIAVVLLAALTLMLTRSGASVDQSGNFEQMRIEASQLMRYAATIEQAIEKLKTINGCSENEISFENSTDTNYNNTNSPDDNSCHVFEPEGAGLSWRTFGDNDLNSASNNMSFANNLVITGVGGDDDDVTGNDLILAARISQGLCNHINGQLGISTTVADITLPYPDWDNQFIGSFVSGPMNIPDDGGTALEGEQTGCLIDDNGHYVFYHAVLPR